MSSDYRMSWEWLAGFTEGEAAIYFYRYEGRMGITTGIAWEQTVDALPSLTISTVKSFLEEEGFFVSETTRGCERGKRFRHRISVQRQGDVLGVLKKLTPLLGDKQEKAIDVYCAIVAWQNSNGREARRVVT